MLRTDARNSGPAYIERLSPIIMPVFRLLEAGSQVAYKFFDGIGAKDLNKHLFSGIVRDHVCRALDDMRLHSTLEFRRVYKANSGIELYFDALRVKVLRPGIDEDGDAVLPPPKNTQQELFYLGNYLPWGNTHVFISNLVMLWDSDHGVRSTSAWLACPDAGKETLFCEPIPHPAERQPAPPPEPPPADDDDLYRRKDVKQPTTKTDTGKDKDGGEDHGEDGGGDDK